MMMVRRLTAFLTSLPRNARAAGGSAMKELVFALEFRGSAGSVPGSDKKMQAKTSATSQTLRSVLKGDGTQASVEAAGGGAARCGSAGRSVRPGGCGAGGGGAASFVSEGEIGGEGVFVEFGSIRYGDAGKVSFRTVGRGPIGPSPLAGLQRGAVMGEGPGG